MRGLWFSLWAASCISFGLFAAWVDGTNARGIIGSAMTMSLIVAAVMAAVIGFNLLKRNRLSRGGQQNSGDESMNEIDLKSTAMMIGGAGLGFAIGSMLFTNLYAIIALSIIGCAAIPCYATWRNRQMQKPRR